jgi:acyl-CoA thioester hydrolase
MEGFDFVHRERVRFSDLDGMGHCNNAVFLTFCEQARIAFLRSLGPTTEHLILARAELDLRSPLFEDDEVEVGVRCSRVGNSSFELEYELRSGDRLAAEAKSVIVSYDYESRAPRPIPEHWREALMGVAA